MKGPSMSLRNGGYMTTYLAWLSIGKVTKPCPSPGGKLVPSIIHTYIHVGQSVNLHVALTLTYLSALSS